MGNTKLELSVEVDAQGAIKGFQLVQAQIAKTTEEAHKLGEAHSSFDKWADKIKEGIENPLHAAGEAASELLKAMGPVGTAVAGAGAVFGVMAAAGFEAAKGLGELGTQISNVSIRTGLTTKEVSQFSYAAKLAGEDVSVFERAMRMLTKGLADNSEDGKKARAQLDAMGVSAKNADGSFRPMSEILIQVSEGLGKIEGQANRAAAAQELFGRSGIELLPVMRELSEKIARAKELGLGPSQDDINRFEKYHKTVTEIEFAWDALARKVKEPLAATILFLLKGPDGAPLKPDDLAKMGIKNPYAVTSTDDFARESARRGFTAPGQGQQWTNNLLASQADASGQAIIDRQQSEATIRPILARWGMTKEGLQEALSQAKRNEKEALDKLRSGDASAIPDFQSAQSRVSGIQGRLDSMNASEAPSYSNQKYYAFLRELDKWNKAQVERAAINAIQMLMEGDKVNESIAAQVAKEIGMGTQESGLGSAMRIINGTRTEPNSPIPLSSEDMFALHQASGAHANRMFGIGGGNAATSAANDYALQVDAAKQETDLGKQRLELARAGYEYEERIAEIRRSSEEQFKGLVGGLFDAALGGGRGIGQFAKGQALGIGRSIAENAAGMVWHPGMTSLPGTGTADNPNFLGKLLQGTMLAPDPLKNAGAVQMNAAQLQYKAAVVFAGAVTGGSGGGGIAGIPGIGTFGSDVGGLTGGDLNFGGSTTGIFGGFGGTSSSGTSSGGGLLGLLGKIPGIGGLFGDRSVSLGAGRATSLSSLVGGGALAGGGLLELLNGAHTGGARGGLQEAGGAAAIAGGILPLLSGTFALAGPIGAAVGALMPLIAGFLGDPRAKRASSISHTLASAHFYDPVALNVSEGFGGGLSDYDRFGGSRSSSLSPFPQVEQSYIDYRNNVTVPGRTLGNFGGPGGNTYVTIHAMDHSSFSSYMKANSNALVDGVIHGVESQGRTDLVEKLRPLL